MKVLIPTTRKQKPARSINRCGERWEVKWITFPDSARLHGPGCINYELLGTTPGGLAMDRGAYWKLRFLWYAELPAGMYRQEFKAGAIEDWCEINNIKIIKYEKDSQYSWMHLTKTQLFYFVLKFRGPHK